MQVGDKVKIKDNDKLFIVKMLVGEYVLLEFYSKNNAYISGWQHYSKVEMA